MKEEKNDQEESTNSLLKKWEKKQRIRPLDQMVETTYRLGQGEESFDIMADGKGVHFDGTLTLLTMGDLEDYAQIISDAWREYEKYRPRIAGV